MTDSNELNQPLESARNSGWSVPLSGHECPDLRLFRVLIRSCRGREGPPGPLTGPALVELAIDSALESEKRKGMNKPISKA